MMMYPFIRPFLFCLEPEKAHRFTLNALHWIPKWFFKYNQPAAAPIPAMGLSFPHPIGLAAGLDKNGEHLDALSKLAFSFIELGTVTPRPQAGNPLPRLFRLPQKEAIINRMGFNNQGVDALISHIQHTQYKGILGINIGKNKDTSLQNAAEDYEYCLRKVYPFASYITINISSPNTPDLRQLQQHTFLTNLLTRLVTLQKQLADQQQRHVPLVVKVSPDEKDETLKQIANTVVNSKIAGIIATNTTCARNEVENTRHGNEIGGLSGLPLFDRATTTLRLLKSEVGEEATLIAAGGIHSPAQANQKLQAGATLLQLYTGLIYKGPRLVSTLIASTANTSPHCHILKE